MKIYGIRRFEFAKLPIYDVGTALFELEAGLRVDNFLKEYLNNQWLINRILKTDIKSKNIIIAGKSRPVPVVEFDRKNNDKHFIWRWKALDDPQYLSNWYGEIQINDTDIVSFESDDDALLWYEAVKDRVKGVEL